MIGRRLAHYEIVAKIGQGGMGEVYRARDTKLNRDIALKLIPDIFAEDAQRMIRFQREAQLLASLNHANIASIYGVEESDGHFALVLELMEGVDLSEKLQSGTLTLNETLEFAKRSGVAIYSIGLGRTSREMEARMRLQRVANDTGGRYFFISRASELAAIYASIEKELRFQYLLAYQSNDSQGDEFRRVEVELALPDLEATTVPGYYP